MKAPATPAERAARLRAMRDAKIASSAHAFVRAHADLFYQEVAALAAIPLGPAIWISGDCHGENLGCVAGAGGESEVEMNDHDETAIGNPAHDVLRLCLSLAIAGEVSGLCGLHAATCARAVVDGYQAMLERRAKDAKLELPAAPARVDEAWKQAKKQGRGDLCARYCGSEHPSALPRGDRFWPLSAAGRAAVEAFAAGPEVRAMLALVGELGEAPTEVLDVGFRVAGTASLGGWRAVALLKTGGSKGDRLHLVDVKEAQRSSTLRAAGGAIPEDDADRIVAGARVLSPPHGARVVAATVQARRVVARELLPQERKIALDRLRPEELQELGTFYGSVVARAHGRQLDAAGARAWRATFLGKSKGAAMTWLWDALVALSGPHRAGYLRHCGAFAAQEAP